MIKILTKATTHWVGYQPLIIATYMPVRCFGSTVSLAQRPDHPLYPSLNWGQIKAGNRAIIDPFDPSAILYVSQREYLSLVKIAVSNDAQITVLATPGDSKISRDEKSSKPGDSQATSTESSAPLSKPTPPPSKERAERARRARLAELMRDFLVPHDLQKVSFLKWGKGSMSWKSWFGRFATPVQSGSVRRLLLPSESNLLVILRRWGYVLSMTGDVYWGPGLKADLFEFSLHCLKVLQHEGTLTLCNRMKLYLFCVNQYLAGNPLKGTGHLGIRVRLANGLPTALPVGARAHIRAGRHAYIRLWSSMLNSYRAFHTTPPTLSMGRIADAPFEISRDESLGFAHFLERFWVAWSTRNPELTKPDLTVRKFPLLTTAGPNRAVSILGSRLDALAWCRSGHLVNLFRAWKAFGVEDVVVETFFASLARAGAHWLSATSTPIAWACERLWTGKSPTFPIRGDFKEVKYRASIPGLRIVVSNPSPEVALLKPAVRRSNVLQNPGFEPKPGCFYDGKQWQPELAVNDQLATIARWVWTSLLPDGSFNPGALQHVQAVATSGPSQEVLPAPPEEAQTKKILSSRLVLGRLSFKYGEPAGKTRWFAIVDYFTQQCLQPLHDFLFKCLNTFPGDATFDQEAAVRRLTKFGPKYWCYDLTAATDVIPLKLYKIMFNTFIGPDKSEAWANLLVDREFVLRAGSVPPSLRPGSVSTSEVVWRGKYTRGQPMGALSSWGALALVHHLLIQYAAWRVGQNPLFDFEAYSVLGDDVVIANAAVAAEYLKVCKSLGVEINESKSFVSEKGFFQFAQRNVMNGVDVSPLSLREETNIETIQDRAAFVRRALDRGYFELPDTGTTNLLRTVVKRFLSPNHALYLSRYIWANKTGLGVDIASKVVAPLLLQPKGPLSGLLRPAEGIVWEWIQSLTHVFASGTSLFYRGTTIPDTQACWTTQDLASLYQTIILPLRDNFERRIRTIRDNYHTLERTINTMRHTVPLLPVAWITRIWADELPIYDRGAHFLHSLAKLIRPGLPAANLPSLALDAPVPPQGVAAGLSSLGALLDYLAKFNTPFDLEKKNVLQPKRSIDKHTEKIRRIWVNSSLPSSNLHGPPRRSKKGGGARGKCTSTN